MGRRDLLGNGLPDVVFDADDCRSVDHTVFFVSGIFRVLGLLMQGVCQGPL